MPPKLCGASGQQPLEGKQPDGGVDVMLGELMKQANSAKVDVANGNTKGKAVRKVVPRKKKANAKALTKKQAEKQAKKKTKAKQHPKAKAKASSKKLVLGCSKSCYSMLGCNDTAADGKGCRNQLFHGKRGHPCVSLCLAV